MSSARVSLAARTRVLFAAAALAVATAATVAAVPCQGSPGVWTGSRGPYGGRVSLVAVSPADAARAYSVASGSFYRSTDAGRSWVAGAGRGIEQLWLGSVTPDPVTPSTVYVTTVKDFDPGSAFILRSTDGGDSWDLRSKGLGLPYFGGLTVDPTAPDTLYAWGSGVHRSTDSGLSWTATGLDRWVDSMAIDPGKHERLLAGGDDGLLTSHDSGKTWSLVSDSPGSINALAWDRSQPEGLLAGTSRGVYRSTDAGVTWRAAGLPGLVVGALATSPGGAWLAVASRHLYRSLDAGDSWALADVADGLEPLAITAAPSAPATFFAGTPAGLFRSTDSGLFTASSEGLAVDINALAVDPQLPSRLFAGTSAGVFRSTDSGVTWSLASAGLGNGSVWALAVGPDAVLAGTTDKGAFRSTDSGGTWLPIHGGLNPAPGISALALDPVSTGTVFAGGATGVYRSTDSGAGWVKIKEGTGDWVTSISIHPAAPRTLYVGTARTVAGSTDSGDHWTDFGEGLPSTPTYLTGLAIDPSGTLYVGAYRPGAPPSMVPPQVYRRTPGGVFSAASAGLGDASVRSLFSPAPGIVYAGTEGRVFRSDDFGSTWTPDGEGLSIGWASVTAFAAAPGVSPFLYAGTGAGVWRTELTSPTRLPHTSTIPIALDVDTGFARYTTELVLTNVGAGPQSVDLTYTPSLGSRIGGGSVKIAVGAGQQQVYPDILTTLRSLGLQIPAASASSPQGGTLTVTYDERVGAVHALARTSSPTSSPFPAGRAGVAYEALDAAGATSTVGLVYGLRSTDVDRSHLAVYNPGSVPVTVRVTLISGDGDGKSVVVSEGLTLPGLGWTQIDDVVSSAGMSNAWARLERTSPGGVFAAYGIVNDRATNDASFLTMEPAGPQKGAMTIPVIVESETLDTELILVNPAPGSVRLDLRYLDDGTAARASVTLAPFEQRLVPGAIDLLRRSGADLGPRGTRNHAGALRITTAGRPGLVDVHTAARTVSTTGGGRFGVFTPAVVSGAEASESAAILGLRSDAFTRSNVAVVNAGAGPSGSITLRLDVHDGSNGGTVARSTTVTLVPGQWVQPGDFFGGSGVANGYVRITRLEGSEPWLAYGVVNDGARPGLGTGDGAYVRMIR